MSCPLSSISGQGLQISPFVSCLWPCFTFPPFTRVPNISQMLLRGGLVAEALGSQADPLLPPEPPATPGCCLVKPTASLKWGPGRAGPSFAPASSLSLQTLPSRRSPRLQSVSLLFLVFHSPSDGFSPVLSQVVKFLYRMCQLLATSGPVASRSYKSQVNGSGP